MAKSKKTSRGACTRQRISFKTKRGRPVQFMGRPGGYEKHGGDCSGKPPVSAAQRAQRARMSKASRKCKGQGKVGSARRAACIVRELAA